MKFLFFMLFLSQMLFAQTKLEKDITAAYQNAKKGIYWALTNIPEKKSSLNNDLIANDRIYAQVKLSKEINGIKIESTGYNSTNEVKISIYKSNDSLIKEGYLKIKKQEDREE